MNVAEAMILTSTGYACGMSTLVGFALARRIKVAKTEMARNLLGVAGAANALLCGAAPIFLLGILALAYPDEVLPRSLLFVGALAAGLGVSFYLSWLDDFSARRS